MSKTFNGEINFPTNFNVQYTSPLDARLVVDSVDDLTNGSIEYPYQGMVVSIAGTSELWILKTQGIEESYNPDNWEMVTGVGSGSGLSKYSIPVMTPEMADDATNDSSVDFNSSEDPYILTDFDGQSLEGEITNNIVTSINGTYLDIMMRAIRDLQSEVARLKNTFEYGIDSYNNKRTAKSAHLGEYDNIETEPLWAIDPGYLSIVPDGPTFNTYLDSNHSFIKIGDGSIDVSVEGQLGFKNCKGMFHDGDIEGKNYTLYELKDSKLITYLVTDAPTITMNLVSLDDRMRTKTVEFEPLLRGNSVNRYGFCIVISRQVEDSKTRIKKGFNYIYFSIINYENDVKLYEGYLTPEGTLSQTKVETDERYSIDSIIFDRLTLSRMKFYTKFEDFTEEVISSAPSEKDWKYEVAHITIRSVENTTMLDEIKDQLRDNELIWNKKSGTLHIKTDGKICIIGSNNKEPEHNNDENMTDKEIIDALVKMGIAVNVVYKKDADGNETDEIESLENLSLAPISDFTFVNGDTGKKFTYSADAEGNLVCKDNSMETIDEFIKRIGSVNAGTYDEVYDGKNKGYVRGFSSDFLFRKKGEYNPKNGVNSTSDAGKNSDRLRVSSFYAPITTDKVHGCTHSFIELENTSDVDIPLTGIYLHFYNPADNDFTGKVYHLALDGVCKAGGTYLIRGAKHAEFDDESAFIKVSTFDKEWYDNGELVSFEQYPVKTFNTTNSKGETVKNLADDSLVKTAYRFCLTYGLPDLSANEGLVQIADKDRSYDGVSYTKKDYPNTILNPRFIDSCSYSTFADVSKLTGVSNPWYINGASGVGITITENSMFRLMFALDPAKQAFNGFNGKDGSRVRYNKAQDLQILKLDKEFIGFPNSKETIRIDKFTPKASFENRNVMTDKTQLDREKPNMVTCSFGNDVYNTRCFNWISCGAFDESVWIRRKTNSVSYEDYIINAKNIYDDEVREALKDFNDAIHINEFDESLYIHLIDGVDAENYKEAYISAKTVYDSAVEDAKSRYNETVSNFTNEGNDWIKFDSYIKDGEKIEGTSLPRRKEYSKVVNNAVYARIIDRFPGNNVLFTSHKCVVILPDATDGPIEYEYVVGRPDKDGNPDMNHCGDVYTFTLYPRTYEGRVYQITDQQGFHWIEYQVWAASAEFLNKKIDEECNEINSIGGNKKVFPILINTGDMTQSGARINEWLDYYNGGKCLFNHLEQINCVGNNDLNPINPNELGTGNDNDKSTARFFHYFYCFDVKDVRYDAVDEDKKKFFSGETLVVPKNEKISDDRYIPSFYNIKTNDVLYIIFNSEIPSSGVQGWYGLDSNIYTGIEIKGNGAYDVTTKPFTPIYETLYAWLKDNQDNDNRKIVVAMHEMPFTVITKESMSYDNTDYLPCTRNHPTAANARVGSNVNQLTRQENRGTYWMSRLLEYFGCKLVIGGHKHTYALSYPIKEKYNWTYNGITHNSGDKLTSGKYDIKPMFSTLEDEAGSNPDYIISWDIDYDTAKSEYSVAPSLTGTPVLNSTKTPYVPKSLYEEYGKTSFESGSGVFRCCTPITVSDDKYDGFITYSMCQATGYKLKSNKELPSAFQVFSKIIPITTHGASSDSPDGNQLYPMYSVLEFNNDCSEVNVYMVRVTNVFKKNGEDKFGQGTYGNNLPSYEYLCTSTNMYGDWKKKNEVTPENIYLHIKF